MATANLPESWSGFRAGGCALEAVGDYPEVLRWWDATNLTVGSGEGEEHHQGDDQTASRSGDLRTGRR